MLSIVKNDLFDYKNRYIMQAKEGFKFSLDSLLLAEYVDIKSKDKLIVDLCTGNLVIPLVLSLKTNAKIIGIEIQEDIYKLAKESLKINKLENQIEIINDDINNIDKYFKKESLDIITCNPPYFKVNKDDYLNKSNYLNIARHEIKMKLEDIFKISSNYLKNKGVLYLIHEVNRLDDIIEYSIKYDVRVKEIQLIKTKSDNKPNKVLVKCIKKSNQGIKVRDVICIENLKTYQNIFKEEV